MNKRQYNILLALKEKPSTDQNGKLIAKSYSASELAEIGDCKVTDVYRYIRALKQLGHKISTVESVLITTKGKVKYTIFPANREVGSKRQQFDKLSEDPLAKKDRNNCTVMATSLLCDIPYNTAYNACRDVGRRKHNHGMTYGEVNKVIKSLGFKLEEVSTRSRAPWNGNKWTVDFEPRQPNGHGYTCKSIHKLLPNKGKYLLCFRGHVCAYVDGKVEDWTNGRKHRVTKVWKITEK